MARRGRENGTIFYLGRELRKNGSFVELEYAIPYTIYPGDRPSWDDPGSPDTVELDLPNGLVLSEDEEDDLQVRAMEEHEWGSGRPGD